jgi:hypothetical protein
MLLKWLHDIKIRYKSWKLGKQEVEMKHFPDGSTVLKTEDMYFLAMTSESTPILISKEEGERLWSLEE